MKTALLACAALMSLTACASGGYGYGGADVGYNAFYDDYYGPVYNGYWGRDGYYYYSTGPRGRFLRDEAHHFRRDQAEGFHAWSGRARDRDRDHDRR